MRSVKDYTVGMMTGSMVGLAVGAAVMVGMDPSVASVMKRKGRHAVRAAHKTMARMGLKV